jgi:hypothetical protein
MEPMLSLGAHAQGVKQMKIISKEKPASSINDPVHLCDWLKVKEVSAQVEEITLAPLHRD